MRLASIVTMSAAATSGGGIGRSSTVIVGLNGALQKRFILPPGSKLIPGNVLRATEIQVGVGGKGQDVAVTLSCLDYTGGLQLSQFVGMGPEGDQVYSMLADLLGESAMGLTVRPANSGMRTCTSIVASDSTTELVEPSGTITASEMNELFQQLQANKNSVSALCFMGSMPPGCPDSTYADIYEIVANDNTLSVIDSVSGLELLIQRIGDSKVGGSTILKINASELCRLVKVQKSASEASGVKQSELMESIHQFVQQYPASKKALKAIAITDGAHPAYVAQFLDKSEIQVYQLPIVPLGVEGQFLYPIGAGDSVAAGLLAAWRFLVDDDGNETAGQSCLPPDISTTLRERNISTFTNNKVLTSFAFGLACGSASCLEEGNSVVQRKKVIDLFSKSLKPLPLLLEALRNDHESVV